MNRRLAVTLTLAAALLGTAFAGTAQARLFGSRPNFSGYWELDRARSNTPAAWEHDGFGDRDFGDHGHGNRGYDYSDNEGFQGRDYSDRPGFRGRGGVRASLLPSRIQIEQNRRMVNIADARNRLVEQIMLSGRLGWQNDRNQVLAGRWMGSKLVVEHQGPAGNRIVQTFELKNRGRVLLVQTRREGFGSRPPVQFENVYRRV